MAGAFAIPSTVLPAVFLAGAELPSRKFRPVRAAVRAARPSSQRARSVRARAEGDSTKLVRAHIDASSPEFLPTHFILIIIEVQWFNACIYLVQSRSARGAKRSGSRFPEPRRTISPYDVHYRLIRTIFYSINTMITRNWSCS